MPEIQIQSSTGPYLVQFDSLKSALEQIDRPSVVIADKNVADAWAWTIPADVPQIIVDAGEASKSMSTYESVIRQLAGSKVTRETQILALGGGVVGDLAGFVAATYMRGMNYLQFPTSLLAMVDSSVGGKVAVDLPEGKNLVGAFYRPQTVHVCLETLATLPKRHITNGMAEVWKYAFIADQSLVEELSQLEVHSVDDFEPVVSRCIEIKARICEEDEFDRTGVRAKLNFGHTVGHALEAVLGYEELLHGEAIAIGMVVEAKIGELLGATESGTANQIAALLQSSKLPTSHPTLKNIDRLVEVMKIDKKSSSGHIGISLVTRLGECKLFPSVPEDLIRSALICA